MSRHLLISVFAMILLPACQGPSDAYRSSDYEPVQSFVDAAASQEKMVVSTPASRVGTPRVNIAAPTERFMRRDELLGLIDAESTRRLKVTAWLNHPTLEVQRRRVSVARERFGQARQLEELLLRYRSYRQPDRHERPIVAPGVEALRGRISDAELAIAWFGLRQALLEHHSEILRESAMERRLVREAEITRDHVAILDDLMAVVEARMRTGGARQADFLALRGERAQLAATVAGIELRRTATHLRRQDLLGGPPPAPMTLLPAVPVSDNDSELLAFARENQPALLAQHAELDRRIASLRLADLNALRSGGAPASGVRAATRAEARERVLEQERRTEDHQAMIERKLLSALAMARSAKLNVDALENQVIPDAREALSDARSAFAGRAGSFLDLFQATRRLLKAQLALAQGQDLHQRAMTNIPPLLGSTQK